jgi:succinyl-diaminopimelate desuccinylase
MELKKLDQLVEGMKEEIIRDTQELIKFRSVEGSAAGADKPFGEEVAASLEYTLDIGKRLGFSVKNLDGYAGYAEYGEGEEMVAVLVHVDIVPEGDGWQYPPFGGEIHDGKIYGRGAVDNKGPAVAAMYALKALADSGAKLKRRVRVIVGANEETGMKCMRRYKETEELPVCGFAPDADYPIINTEKGIMSFNLRKKFAPGSEGDVALLNLKGGTVANSVPDYCEAVLKVTRAGKTAVEEALARAINIQEFKMSKEDHPDGILIKSFGVAAHGSTPEQGKNAISQMMVFLNTLPFGDNEQARFIHEYVVHIGMEYNGQSIGVGFSDELSGLLIFNVGVAKMDQESADLRVNIRYPVANTGEEVVSGIKESLQGTGIELENLSDSKPHHVPGDHFLIQALSKVYEEMTGDKTRLIAIGGGTYARTMPNSVAFGPGIPGQPDVAHKENEFIAIDNLLLNTKITARALYELAKAD